jgi:hypothetical protein
MQDRAGKFGKRIGAEISAKISREEVSYKFIR